MFDNACICVALWLTCDSCCRKIDMSIQVVCRGIMILLRPETILIFLLDNILKIFFERNHYLPSLNSLCLRDTMGMVYWRQTWGKKIYHHASNQGGIPITRQMLKNLDCERLSQPASLQYVVVLLNLFNWLWKPQMKQEKCCCTDIYDLKDVTVEPLTTPSFSVGGHCDQVWPDVLLSTPNCDVGLHYSAVFSDLLSGMFFFFKGSKLLLHFKY